PLRSNLDDEEERRRLAKVFERGLGRIIGYALPIRPGEFTDSPRWESGPWFLRQEHMFLIPGDSPMGLRLPLDSIPWVAAEDHNLVPERDPFHPREPLPPYYRRNGKNGAEQSMAQSRASVAARARVLMPQYAGVAE